MNETPYSVLADDYDALMEDVDYAAWGNFYEAQFGKYCKTPPKLVLDLGCGTGRLTTLLSTRGYEMIGIDRSAEMLSRAQRRAEEERQKILYLEQDMRAFDLYGTVDAVVCSLDCVNYLTKKEDAALCFDRVHTFLIPGGLFIFDVNTVWKFENLFGDQCYTEETDNVFLSWQNRYTKSTGLCRFYLTVFRETENGLWERFEEEQKERAYSDAALTKLLTDAGFSVLDIVSDTDGTPAGKEDERHFFVCRRLQNSLK